MAVNKPTQIEPSNDDDGKPKRASLLERASGTFGFDRLIPAAVPAKVDSDKAKKFAPRRRDTGALGDSLLSQAGGGMQTADGRPLPKV